MLTEKGPNEDDWQLDQVEVLRFDENRRLLKVAANLEKVDSDEVIAPRFRRLSQIRENIFEVIQEKINPSSKIQIHDNFDFEEIATVCKEIKPDILIGNSKGYYIARELGIPLARVGFPIHDRLGGSRIKHIGYEGTQALFDLIANTLIQQMQENSPVGYKYM